MFMKKPNVAILTDTNSGIFAERAKEMGIFVISMPFFLDGQLYYEGDTISMDSFFEQMKSNPQMEFKTSMPSPGYITEVWKKLLETHDEVVYIPMSSGLSASCSVAQGLSEDFDGKVQVVDNQRISLTQYSSVMDAINLKEAGKNALEIKTILEDQKFQSSIYIMVDTLDYLKKGGRVTPGAALLGGFLRIKPVLQIQGEKLDSLAKARGIKAAKNIMIKALKEDLEGRFSNISDEMELFISYSYQSKETVDQWIQEVRDAFPGYTVTGDPLSLVISCHTGPGALGIGCARRVKA